MGTEKRQRQKEGRQARIAAAEAAQRKAATRQRILSFAGLAALIVVFIVAITYFTRDDNSSTDVASTDTSLDTSDPSSSSTDAPLESAAGKPCVAVSDPLPTGAPDVPVQVGPPPTTLVKEDIVVGTGDVVEPGATVTVNYIGVACSTGKIFDSSYQRGTAATFTLAQVIPGWTQGIPGMKVGGQRLLGIPSELAYGADGSPNGGIAPDEALWFVVEVTNTVPPSTTTTAPRAEGARRPLPQTAAAARRRPPRPRRDRSPRPIRRRGRRHPSTRETATSGADVSTSKYKQRLAKERKAAAIIAAREAAERRRRLTILGAIAGVVVLVAVIAGIVVLSSDDDSGSNVAADGSTSTTVPGFTYGTAECAPASGPPEPPKLDFAGTGGFQQCIGPAHVYTATFDTSAGPIVVQLDSETTPGTVNNFVQLAGWGYYNGSKLFRTDTSIGIIQGGAPQTNSASDPGPGYTIDDEGSGFTYQPGQLVMARTQAPNSAGSQFFFTVTDKVSSLDAQGTYVVFGTVTSGLDLLTQILATNVEGTDGLGGSPNPAIVINSITIGEASLANGSTTTLPTSTTVSPSSTTTAAPS